MIRNREKLKASKRENRELKRINEILHTARTFFTQPQIDGCGLRCVERVQQIKSQFFLYIKRLARLHNRPLRELGVDTPLSGFVGIGQQCTLYWRTSACVAKLHHLCRQAHLDILQTPAIGLLGESQRTKVLGSGKYVDSIAPWHRLTIR
jgi:hypothetical protein